MARRPIFFPCPQEGEQIVGETELEFTWNPGLAISQKQKNIEALHKVANARTFAPVLEVSTKSKVRIGQQLSAFNLSVRTQGGMQIPLESAFQGSKKFLNAGPFMDLYGKSGAEVRRDDRLRSSGPLESFIWNSETWPLEPKTVFYDWLYCNAVHAREDLRGELAAFKAFTDIEFNPKKSINCQARSCALYLGLISRGKIETALSDRTVFLRMLADDARFQSHSRGLLQGSLF